MMTKVAFPVDGVMREGYLALPPGGSGRGILVLHAWWGLNDFFKSICDRLAAHGFVAFAPDVHHGLIATTVEEAEHILETRDLAAAQATAEAALRFLRSHSAVTGEKLGALGASMGAVFAYILDSQNPGAFDRVVMFYGPSEIDFAESQTQFQCHFAENDEWEPVEGAQKIAAPNAEVFIYPGTQHWFIEADRPGFYDADAARLAWDRTVEFLGRE